MDNDWEEGTYFLEALVFSLEKKRDFELVQAYLSVFLKVFHILS